jgi:hypothetical protein
LWFPAGELTLEELKGAPEEVREQLKEVAGTEDDGMDEMGGMGQVGSASVEDVGSMENHWFSLFCSHNNSCSLVQRVFTSVAT